MNKHFALFAAVFFSQQLFAQNVGIGIATPNASGLLHVDLGASTTKGFLLTGTRNFSSSFPDLGAGSRLMFYPGKAAFRAGFIGSTQWDNANVGYHSGAMGENVIASGSSSFAFGSYNTSSGTYAITLGGGNKATSTYSTAIGGFNTSSGWYTIAMGAANVASGRYSTAMSLENVAKGYASTVIGMYNDSLLAADEIGVTATTPLFMIGNGNAVNDRSNAFVVQKRGYVGIGDIVPEYSLDVANRMRLRGGGDNNSSPGIWFNKVDNSGQVAFFGVLDNNTVGIYGTGGSSWNLNMNINTGNVGIGTVAPSQKLQVIGNICATGTIAACSDVRYKTNLQPLSDVLSSLLSITPIYYHWKTGFKEQNFTKEKQLGFSAQEIEKYFPQIVQTNSDGYKAVDYGRMTPVLVQAIKEQQEQIDDLKTQNKMLQKKNQLLDARLEKLEKMVATKF